MARAVKKPLGGTRGRVGDVIYRYMNGRTFISVYNGDIKVSQTKEAKNNRSKFGNTIMFSKAVNSVIDLKKVWDFSNSPGRSAYTKIFKFNSQRINADYISKYCKITPGGIGCKIQSFEFNPSSVALEYQIEKTPENNLTAPYKAHFVIYLSDTTNSEFYPPSYFVNASKIVEEETPSDYQTIVCNFIDSTRDAISVYKKATVFFAITKTDTKPYEWSYACSKEFTIS